jgi:hypothetical protein
MFLPRRNRALEALECRALLSVAPRVEPAAPLAAPFELRSDALVFGPRFEFGGGLRGDPGGGLRGESAAIETASINTGLAARVSAFTDGPSPLVTAIDVGSHVERSSFTKDAPPAYELTSPLAWRLGGILHQDSEALNPAILRPVVLGSTGIPTGYGYEVELFHWVDLSAHDAVFTKLAITGADRVIEDVAAYRPLVLGFEVHVQATATAASGASQHIHEDTNPQGDGPRVDRVLSVLAWTPVATTAVGDDGALREPSPMKSAESAAVSWAAPEHGRSAELDRAVWAAARHALSLAERAQIGAILATAVETIDAPWGWASAVPLTPQLAVDAEQLGQALSAVLTDLDELGGQIADSLTDGNRAFWGLAAGGVACYVVGRRFNATAAEPELPRGKTARRRALPWLLQRFPVAR